MRRSTRRHQRVTGVPPVRATWQLESVGSRSTGLPRRWHGRDARDTVERSRYFTYTLLRSEPRGHPIANRDARASEWRRPLAHPHPWVGFFIPTAARTTTAVTRPLAIHLTMQSMCIKITGAIEVHLT